MNTIKLYILLQSLRDSATTKVHDLKITSKKTGTSASVSCRVENGRGCVHIYAVYTNWGGGAGGNTFCQFVSIGNGFEKLDIKRDANNPWSNKFIDHLNSALPNGIQFQRSFRTPPTSYRASEISEAHLLDGIGNFVDEIIRTALFDNIIGLSRHITIESQYS